MHAQTEMQLSQELCDSVFRQVLVGMENGDIYLLREYVTDRVANKDVFKLHTRVMLKYGLVTMRRVLDTLSSVQQRNSLSEECLIRILAQKFQPAMA